MKTSRYKRQWKEKGGERRRSTKERRTRGNGKKIFTVESFDFQAFAAPESPLWIDAFPKAQNQTGDRKLSFANEMNTKINFKCMNFVTKKKIFFLFHKNLKKKNWRKLETHRVSGTLHTRARQFAKTLPEAFSLFFITFCGPITVS